MTKKSFLRAPYRLGSLELPNNVFYSPLAGCSDFPFRKMAAKWRPGLFFCEMVKMDALVRNDPNTFRILDYEKEMHPIAAQVCGSKPELAATCAKILESLGFCLIDLNCGCPVDKVTKDGSGSGMLRTPERIGEIISNMVAAVDVPITVKIRAGWDEESINAPLITQIAESAGAKAIFIHGRTRKQAYRGPANWSSIREAKQVAKSIQVFGNGDVVDGRSALSMFDETGCDGVLLSRGTMGNPWIVEDVIGYLTGHPEVDRTQNEYRDALLEHLELIAHYQPYKRFIQDARRIGCWYIKKACGTREFRQKMSSAESMEEVFDLVKNL